MTGIFERNFDQELMQGAPLAAASLAADSLALEKMKKHLQDEAYTNGFRAGEAEARQEAEANLSNRQQAALETLVNSLAELRDETDAHRQAVEHQLLEFALNTCELVLPEVLSATSKRRVVDQIKRCITLAGGVSTLTVTVSETVMRDHGAELANLGGSGEGTRITVQADPSMEDGDARVAWQHGSMTYSLPRITQSILGAVRQALAEAQPETTQDRNVTHD
ncbi:MAG: FliH/SctL family protein [Pseudomonadota bacterium]